MLAGKRPAPIWVDIWADPKAAAFVRSINDGNETVPTVVMGERIETNPPPSVVREFVSSAG